MASKLYLFCCLLAFSAAGENAADLWDIAGDFGRAEGKSGERRPDGVTFEGKGFRVETLEDCDANGVTWHRTRFVNTGTNAITAHCLMDRFQLPEGDWEVYTQASHSQNESRGAWQPLHTGVCVHSPFLRSCRGAAPMMALWNRQTGRGRVYHLLTDSSYLIQLSLRIHPVLDPTATYAIQGESRLGAAVMRDGLEVKLDDISATEMRLVRKP